MSTIWQDTLTFLSYMILAVFVQNAVFTRGLGASRLVRLVSDSAVSPVRFCLLLCLTLTLNAPLAFFADRFLAQDRFWYRSYLRPFAYALCATVVLLVLWLVTSIIRFNGYKVVAANLPLASFNCAVLGPLLVNNTQNHTLLQSVGFALGSGIGYSFAVLFVMEGQRKLNNRRVPATFRGMPANLLYIGILALAIYGLTGHRVTI